MALLTTRICRYILLFWTAPLLLSAQAPLELTRITIEQGLPQGYVASMCQDREGFMWFSTNDGLCRYDGYTFLVFRHDPYDSYSISHNLIVQVVDVGDFLCILTQAGVDLMDRKTHRFYHLMTEKAGFVVSDHLQTLYFVKEGKPVSRIVLTPEVVAQLRHSDPDQVALPLEEVQPETGWQAVRLSEDRRLLWLLKENGRELCCQNLVTRQLQRLSLPVSDSLLRMQNDGFNGVWLGGPASILHIDSASMTAPRQHIRATHPVQGLLHYDRRQQLFWMYMAGSICGFRFDLQHLPGALSPEQAEIRLPIPEGVVCGFTDQSGITWFGTNAHGIRQFNPRAAAFKNYLPGLSIFSSPFVDAQGDIWLGRINQTIGKNETGHRLDLATGQMKPYPFAAVSRDLFAVYTIVDEAGDLWASGQNTQKPVGQLIHYQPNNGRTEVFTYPVDPHRYFDMLVLRFEAPHSIWIYSCYQMLRFDRQTHQFTSYDYSQLAEGAGPSVMAVALTADGSQWIALPGAIIRAQPDGTGGYHFSKLQNDPTNRNSLPINNIKCLLTDPADAGILWIGTGGGGLSRLDTRTGNFTHFNTRNGLLDDVVYGIVAERPYFWISTNKGLAKFNPVTRQFQSFLQSDGLPGNEFNTYAYGKTPDGRLIFGGVNGLTVFDPDDLVVNAQPPEVHLTALYINGRLLAPGDSASLLTQDIGFTESLELNHTQNNLLFQFAALDYAKPPRNQFQFFLEGAESQWAHRGFEHSAQYLNLPPGTYTFQVKAANSDGTWNNTPTRLRIVIHPAWYASGWAYALYSLLAAGAVYGFYQIQLRRRLDHAETRRLQELDQVKTRLYTNITHEFRTPLTVILGLTEQVKQYLTRQPAPSQASQLETVQRNGSHLLQLINQLLDLSKLEAGSMTLQLQRGDVVAYFKYITESFHSYATAQGVQLHFLSDLPVLEMDYDPEKLQMIVVNLLSNAIKFTPAGGHIDVQIKETEQKNQSWLSLRVKDTGVGIAPEKLPYVFDRFYQADDSSTKNSGGTGIGLALVRELVRLMQGDISVSSQPGQGAVFTVLLPVSVGISTFSHEPLRFNPTPDPTPKGEGRRDVVTPLSFRGGVETSSRLDEASIAADSSLPTLLIVEDHADVADYVAACVREQYQILLARNGQAGIERAFETIPDLIISDVMMPEKDGFEVCETLKNDERTSHIPIVLLTARVGVEDRIAGLRRGADAYLAKPFHPDELRVVLSNLLEIRQKLQAKYAHADWGNGTVAAQPTNAEAADVPDPEDIFLQKMRTVVEARLSDSTLTGEEVCRSLGMSYPVVYRKLSALTGRSLNVYIRLIRLQHGRKLLTSTTLTVSEIAYTVGFNDPKFFSRVFSEEFGAAPSAYRQQ